jgi:hypothetical protein
MRGARLLSPVADGGWGWVAPNLAALSAWGFPVIAVRIGALSGLLQTTPPTAPRMLTAPMATNHVKMQDGADRDAQRPCR